ncbi:zinc finger protein jing homolog [Drosophila mojavensis]|uniref:DUF753 domain-containing protein n=1 Tax=Drosophila mojavensis TaxID=7230 RepID=B4KJP0_DROMO|nr:zinc finger protein jing homolog [Drosophila mojavensis]EDW11485.1 uncharacterized protein Dmoj_GI14227 [Drosophila mojavensis]
MNVKFLCWLLLLLLHGSLAQDQDEEEVHQDVEMVTGLQVGPTIEVETESDKAMEDRSMEQQPDPELNPKADNEIEIKSMEQQEKEKEPEPAAATDKPEIETETEMQTDKETEPEAANPMDHTSTEQTETEAEAEPDKESHLDIPFKPPKPATDTDKSKESQEAGNEAEAENEKENMSKEQDYQDEGAALANPPSPEQPLAPAPTEPVKQVNIPLPVLPNSCYSCSSYRNGSCLEHPKEQLNCQLNGKRSGCYTLYKRDTQLIMRGCSADLAEEGDKYCRKETKLCQFCNSSLCNSDLAPNAGAAELLASLTILSLCVTVLLG